MTWDSINQFLGIKDFVDFISSPAFQSGFFLVKAVFIAFTVIFFLAVVYFYVNSSYLYYQFWQDVSEFFSWQAYGLRGVSKRWSRLMKKTEANNEQSFKLAIIEADDFLYQVLEEKGYDGETFEDLINKAGKRALSNFLDVLESHRIRNLVMYNPDYALDIEQAKKILAQYESAIKNIATS